MCNYDTSESFVFILFFIWYNLNWFRKGSVIVHRIIIVSLFFYYTVFVAHPRGMKVKEVKCEGLQATVVQRAAESNYYFKSVLFAIINCSETASLAREVFRTKIATECRNYAKQKTTSFFCSSAAIHFFCSSIFGKTFKGTFYCFFQTPRRRCLLILITLRHHHVVLID